MTTLAFLLLLAWRASTPAPPPLPHFHPVGTVDLIVYESLRQGVQPQDMVALAWRESRWQQATRSDKGAVGVFQIMPRTLSLIGLPFDLKDRYTNIFVGVYWFHLGRAVCGTRKGAFNVYAKGTCK